MMPRQRADATVSALFGLSRGEQIRVVESAILAARREALAEAADLAERSQSKHEDEGTRWYDEACRDIADALRVLRGA